MTDKLGDRLKDFEAVWTKDPGAIPPDHWAVIRVDGRAFHTFTRGADKPFDAAVSEALTTAAGELVREVDGAVVAYCQSDEISVIVPARKNGEHWFRGWPQKIASVSASIITAHFNSFYLADRPSDQRPAMFDARVFAIRDPLDVRDYLFWRQVDATRNAVSMIAQERYSPKQLHGKSTGQRLDMLWNDGIDIRTFDPGDRRGRVVHRVLFETEVEYVRNGETIREQATRSRMDTHPAPLFGDFDRIEDILADIERLT